MVGRAAMMAVPLAPTASMPRQDAPVMRPLPAAPSLMAWPRGSSCARMKAPARAREARPSRRSGWNRCQAWIMCGQASRVTGTSAAAATPASRTASSRSVSAEPTWISVGGRPARSA